MNTFGIVFFCGLLSISFGLDVKCPPQVGNHTIYLPNPEDCSSYFICSNDVPILLHCPPGLHWNAAINVCDLPGNAHCEVSTTEMYSTSKIPTTMTMPITTTTSIPTITTTIPTSTTLIPSTTEIIPTTTSTSPITTTTVSTPTSTFPTTTTTAPTTITTSPTTTTAFPTTTSTSPTTTTAFPTSTSTSPTTTTSIPTTTTTIPSTTTSPFTTPTLPTSTITTPSTTTTLSTTTTTNPIKCPPQVGNHTIYLPNPEDCSTYFMCSNGVPILLHCPPGLHWNAAINVCDLPGNAHCEVSTTEMYSASKIPRPRSYRQSLKMLQL